MAARSFGLLLKFNGTINHASVACLPQRSISNMLNWEPKDKETHTGQKWEDNDYRMVRFLDKTKLVNPNWAVKLIADTPPIPVQGRVTSCDGGGGPTGHPKVYINLDKPGNHACLYCGLRFYKESDKHSIQDCSLKP